MHDLNVLNYHASCRDGTFHVVSKERERTWLRVMRELFLPEVRTTRSVAPYTAQFTNLIAGVPHDRVIRLPRIPALGHRSGTCCAYVRDL